MTNIQVWDIFEDSGLVNEPSSTGIQTLNIPTQKHHLQNRLRLLVEATVCCDLVFYTTDWTIQKIGPALGHMYTLRPYRGHTLESWEALPGLRIRKYGPAASSSLARVPNSKLTADPAGVQPHD